MEGVVKPSSSCKHQLSMSILQEYEQHRKILGDEKIDAIPLYIVELKKLNIHLSYPDIIYNRKEWQKFEDWFENVYNIKYGKGAEGNKAL